jgi:hypothetical protein
MQRRRRLARGEEEVDPPGRSPADRALELGLLDAKGASACR